MRIILLIVLCVTASTLKAQTFLPGGFSSITPGLGYNNPIYLNDSSSQKKWFVTRYSALSTSFSFFRGGHATVIAAPVGLQLNRRLNANLYAFANATIAPAYINFSRSFTSAHLNKELQSNNQFRSGILGMYSSASLGLLYVNDEKTFSLSGRISVERSSYPVLPYYGQNRWAPNPAIATNR